MVQRDLDSERVSQSANNLKTNRVRNRQCRSWWARQQFVELDELTWVNAGSVVQNVDLVPVGFRVKGAGDVDSGTGRRMLSSVLHELGKQVSKILCLRAGDIKIVERDRDDPSIIFDLADRDAQNLTQFTGRAMSFRCLCIGEHQKALGVATHAGSQVVDSVHKSKTISVALFGFEGVDGLKLAIDKRLVTASEVHERVGDSALEHRHTLPYRICALANSGKAFGNFTEFVLAKVERLTIRSQFSYRCTT